MISVLSRSSACPSRGAAFAIHFVLSLLVFSTLVACMLVFWFPGDLFFMDGGWEGLKLVAMIDLILGPALTLLLFKPGKPGLKLDLSVIAAVQIAALGYGFYTTYNQRTVAVVFAENTFATISANDKRIADENLAQRDIKAFELPPAKPFAVPQYITPEYKNMGKYIAELLNDYPDAHHRSDQYVALKERQPKMQQHAKSMDDLEEAGTKTLVRDALRKHKLSMDQVEIYRFRARYANGYALFDPEKARVIDFVNNKADKPDNLMAENAG